MNHIETYEYEGELTLDGVDLLVFATVEVDLSYRDGVSTSYYSFVVHPVDATGESYDYEHPLDALPIAWKQDLIDFADDEMVAAAERAYERACEGNY